MTREIRDSEVVAAKTPECLHTLLSKFTTVMHISEVLFIRKQK